MDTAIPISEAARSEKNDIDCKSKQGKTSLAGKISKFVARHPRKTLFSTFVVSFIFSYVGIVVGNFSIAVDNDGWRSRGTSIANREMQNEVLSIFRDALRADVDGSVWKDLQENVQTGFVAIQLDQDQVEERRNLQIDNLSNCNASEAYGEKLMSNNLFAAYKTEPEKETSGVSILDPEILLQICEAETTTHMILEENKACGGCEDEKCLPPLSLIMVLRMELNATQSTCEQLIEAYAPKRESFTETLMTCVNGIVNTFDPVEMSYSPDVKCPMFFFPSMVDSDFGQNGNTLLRYSSSYFITYQQDDQVVYDIRPHYGKTDDKLVRATYDTMSGTQTDIFVDSVLASDMSLALASLMITFTAMAVHTKSMWLTIMGIVQLIFAIPLSYFVYYVICGIEFFPFLNFIGVFVAAAIGADGVFVAVDKWKNARIENPSYSTEGIAAIALPNAASAMLLTTSTTAVAFFATTICPVAPILCFALFCGLLITFNYVLNVIFVLPALCLYDIWMMKGSRNCCVTFACCAKSTMTDSEADKTIIDLKLTEEKKDDNGQENHGNETEAQSISRDKKKSISLIHKILSSYFYILNKFRYIILLFCVLLTAVCIYFALEMRLPDEADVRLLPKDHEFEQHHDWSSNLLSSSLFITGYIYGRITWGLVPSDTGVRNNPDSLSQLFLDESFNPSTIDSQNYLLEFCDNLFAEAFASSAEPGVKCHINIFDDWLKEQASSDTQVDAYLSHCNNADSLPMSEDDFEPCFIAWSLLAEEKDVLANGNKINVLQIKMTLNVAWTAPYTEMNEFWNNLENWIIEQNKIAPPGLNNMYTTAPAFWWYDTNGSMLQTAIGAAGIAIAFSAFVVLFSSRSLPLTMLSCLSILYVLAATTASLVGFGWSLGFLESVCFAILIGISCDFVIHFGHAYIHPEGPKPRQERSKFALLHMGPSILAASVTTIAAAVTMIFCIVTFFQKFALILLMTIIHATIGSFMIYLVFTTTIGPSEPTKFIDGLFSKCKKSD